MKEKVLKIMYMCYEISNNTKSDVFFHYSPHTNAVEVWIYENGWISKDELVNSYMRDKPLIPFEEWIDNKTVLTCYIELNPHGLDNIISELEKLLVQ